VPSKQPTIVQTVSCLCNWNRQTYVSLTQRSS
jgi:hypothetical protein